MQKTDPRRLVCTQCKHENEIERVYCHNCGEKLDRSLLPQIDEVKSAEDQSKNARKIKSMMNPNRFALARSVKTFVLLLIFAALVAVAYLATQAPANVPPMKSDRLADIEVTEVWSGMMNTRPAVSVALKEFDVNSYLRKTVKGADGALGTKFERAFAQFEPGVVTVVTQRNAWGLPLYNSVSFKPVLADGKWTADVQKVAIGRLMIPGKLAKLTKLDTVVLSPFSKVFEREIKQLDRLATIEPGENVISLATKPAQ